MRKYTVEYDAEADAAYIRLEKKSERKGAVDKTVEFGYDGMQADLDAKGNVIGVEILNFSKRKVTVNELIAKGIENIQIARGKRKLTRSRLPESLFSTCRGSKQFRRELELERNF